MLSAPTVSIHRLLSMSSGNVSLLERFAAAAYVIHVIDESLLRGSFGQKVRQHWPEYSWTKFLWFNTGYFVIMIGSVVGSQR